MPDAPRKYFTVEEANRRLPLVRAIVGDIVRQYAEIRERKERLAAVQKSGRNARREKNAFYADEVAQIEQELEQQIEILQAYIVELEQLGGELKDLETGLVDFRARLEGREVYLCWRLGEDEVGHWHELDAGVQGRQSLFAGFASSDPDAPEDRET